MCIHHINYHLPCGHTTQSPNLLEYCNPVLRALQFYHDQPRRAARSGRGRCFTLDCMKPPRPCGGDRINSLRNITVVSSASATLGTPPHSNNSNNIATIHPSKPPHWTPAMTSMAKTLFANGEDVQSVTLLLETEFPVLVDRVQESWLHHLHSCFHAHGALTFVPEQDLDNSHLAGDIVTRDVAWGCGRVGGVDGGGEGEEKCGTGWNNGYRYGNGNRRGWCPFFHGGEMGTGAAGVTGMIGGLGEGGSLHQRAVGEMHAQARLGRDLPLRKAEGNGSVVEERVPVIEVVGEEKKEPGRRMGREYIWPLLGGDKDDEREKTPETEGAGMSLKVRSAERKLSVLGQDVPSPSLEGDGDEEEEEEEMVMKRLTVSGLLPDLQMGRGGLKGEVMERAVSVG